MASISNDGGGRRRIQFVAGDGKRKTIRLGEVSQRQAEDFRGYVQALIGQAITGAVDDRVSRWVAERDDATHAKLAGVGLVKPRNRTAATLATFIDDFFKTLNVKPATIISLGNTKRCLIDFFGASKPLRDIGPADADQWRQHLQADGLAEATISRRVGQARQFFRRAVKWKLIGDNPFADVSMGSQTNKSRQRFISREDAQKVLDACPDIQWKLIFALSRFGGLRTPSEHLLLTWADVDWEHNRIRVSSPKTEHHAGKDCRYIPLFPELHPLLLEGLEASEGEPHVISRYRDTRQNLRTHLCRIIRRAGLTPWPKLFHNLRASRQTELAEQFPLHVVCAWIGNSRAIAQDHYLQVTDAHFQKAVQAVQNPAQQVHREARKDNVPAPVDSANHSVNVGDADVCGSSQESGMGRTGLEPVTSSL